MRLGEFEIEVDSHIRVEPYSCDSYEGAIFWDQHLNKYDLVINPHFGPRLIFNLRDGRWNDVPFKESTFGFMPEGIRVRRISN